MLFPGISRTQAGLRGGSHRAEAPLLRWTHMICGVQGLLQWAITPNFCNCSKFFYDVIKPASKLISSESQLEDKEGKILTKLCNQSRFTVLIVQIYCLGASRLWEESTETATPYLKRIDCDHTLSL